MSFKKIVPTIVAILFLFSINSYANTEKVSSVIGVGYGQSCIGWERGCFVHLRDAIKNMETDARLQCGGPISPIEQISCETKNIDTDTVETRCEREYSCLTQNNSIYADQKSNPVFCSVDCEEVCLVDPWFCTACRRLCEPNNNKPTT
ncbi:MAG: hypothetical protein AB8E15_04265 [Bdellovibrionales bacterium]